MGWVSVLLDEFLTWGAGVGWSAGTVRLYRWYLLRLFGWLADAGVVEPCQVSRQVVRAWAASLGGWSLATRRGACGAARSWLRWCADEGYIAAGCAAWVPVPVVRSSVQRTLSAAEVVRLLDACGVRAERGVAPGVALRVSVRNAAIVALLYDSLLRAGELCALDVADCDVGAGRLLVRRGKGGRGRVAVFGRETAALLGAWVEVRPGVAPFFVSLGGGRFGERLTARGLRVVLQRLGDRAGVPGVSPHAFRRGGAVAATLNGAPGRLVQAWAGWSSSRMLDVYTRALEGSAGALDAFAAYSPVGRALST
jgi:integrase/recombinase XerD